MPKNVKLPWIQIGYQSFAKDGPKGLKIEPLARQVGKNKSSFYHHFADMEIFIDQLLTYHLTQAKAITARMQSCQKMVPDLVNILTEVQQDLLFNRQLRIHRNIPEFKKCFEQTNDLVTAAILPIWTTALGLEGQSYLANLVLNLTIENFYLSISAENLTSDWLVDYLNDIRLMVSAMIKNKA